MYFIKFQKYFFVTSKKKKKTFITKEQSPNIKVSKFKHVLIVNSHRDLTVLYNNRI